MEIVFANYNNIKEYARVMYYDVKDVDKYDIIAVTYDGKDIKDLLDYLFDIEQKLEEKENIIKEVREYIISHREAVDERGEHIIYFLKDDFDEEDILEILDKENKE